jgi:hypothetical protein
MTWSTMDTAPMDGSEVDLWMYHVETEIFYRETDCIFAEDGWNAPADDGGFYWIDHPGVLYPTHWMYAPDPPVTASETQRKAAKAGAE